MNERIRELAEQASHQSPDGYPVTIPYSKDFAEKFAELIVKECIERVELQANEFGDAMRLERASAAWEISQDLREHFGVEE